jgi:hypothetical protein
MVSLVKGKAVEDSQDARQEVLLHNDALTIAFRGRWEIVQRRNIRLATICARISISRRVEFPDADSNRSHA